MNTFLSVSRLFVRFVRTSEWSPCTSSLLCQDGSPVCLSFPTAIDHLPTVLHVQLLLHQDNLVLTLIPVGTLFQHVKAIMSSCSIMQLSPGASLCQLLLRLEPLQLNSLLFAPVLKRLPGRVSSFLNSAFLSLLQPPYLRTMLLPRLSLSKVISRARTSILTFAGPSSVSSSSAA